MMKDDPPLVWNPAAHLNGYIMIDSKTHNPLTILIVDNETNISKTLSCCLTAEGHIVSAVSNPADAVEAARHRAFDWACIDLKLGNESGMELIPALLLDSRWIQIVVITAYASIKTAVEAMRRGAACKRGTLFLDEIGDVTPSVQSK